MKFIIILFSTFATTVSLGFDSKANHHHVVGHGVVDHSSGSCEAAPGKAPEDFINVSALKAEILDRARAVKGQGDPESSIQNSLMPFVERLLELDPQPPIESRLTLLEGPWKQVWGPYEYRENDRSVDETTDPDNIYQVVFPGGYYYNVGPVIDPATGAIEKISLLRGEYEVQEGPTLEIGFTKLTSVKTLVGDLDYEDLPALSEAGTLANEKTTLPSALVRLFFPGGTLSELYTDSDLRIAIGNSDSSDGVQNYLYIMERP